MWPLSKRTTILSLSLEAALWDGPRRDETYQWRRDPIQGEERQDAVVGAHMRVEDRVEDCPTENRPLPVPFSPRSNPTHPKRPLS